MSELLFLSVFSGLAWGDTKCAHTFTNLAGLIFMKVHYSVYSIITIHAFMLSDYGCTHGVQVPEGSLPPQTVKKLFEQVLVVRYDTRSLITTIGCMIPYVSLCRHCRGMGCMKATRVP